MNETGENRNRKWIIIGAFALFVILGLLLFWFFGMKEGGDTSLTKEASFGELGSETARPETEEGEGMNIGLPGGTPQEGEQPILRKLTSRPVAGTYYYVSDFGRPTVRFLEKEKGNIYDVDVSTSEETRITNTTILRIHDAWIGEKGDTVLFRYPSSLESVTSRMATVLLNQTPDGDGVLGALVEGDFLPENVTEGSLAPDKQSLFFLRNIGGKASGELLTLSTRAITHVFDFPVAELLSQLSANNTVYITTKASGLFPGYSYEYKIDKRVLRKLIDEKQGLTTLYSPSGKKVLYSEVAMGKLLLGLIDFSAGADTDVRPPGIVTLPEKCVWKNDETRIFCAAPDALPRALLPDSWYQGKVAFSDKIWMHDFTTDSSVPLADPETLVRESIDVINPFLAPDGETLFFVNKNDDSLWALTLRTPAPTTLETEALSPEELKDAQGSLPINPN